MPYTIKAQFQKKASNILVTIVSIHFAGAKNSTTGTPNSSATEAEY